MSDFLRLLAPRHPDALRPAAPLRALATPLAPVGDTQAPTGKPEAPAVAALREDPHSTGAGGMRMQHPWTSASPQTTRGRRPAMHPAPVVPGAEKPSAFDAVPPDLPTSQPNDAALRGALPPRSAAAAIQPADHDPSVLAPRPPPRSTEDARPPSPSPRSSPEHPAAPLSATAVALLAPAAAPTAPPAIHISIDRIEVRAPAPPAKPPPRPRTGPQAQSLHDYLRRKPSP